MAWEYISQEVNVKGFKCHVYYVMNETDDDTRVGILILATPR